MMFYHFDQQEMTYFYLLCLVRFFVSCKGGKIASSDMSQTFVLSDCIQTSPQRLPKVDSGIIVDQDGRQDPISAYRQAANPNLYRLQFLYRQLHSDSWC
jgi:hypothetical protein